MRRPPLLHVIPTQVGISASVRACTTSVARRTLAWVPAYAGMTVRGGGGHTHAAARAQGAPALSAGHQHALAAGSAQRSRQRP